jgi:hypothetical protein
MTTDSAEAVEPMLETGQLEGDPNFLHSVTGQTSWWVVSILFHALVIMLAALVSIAIKMPSTDDTVIMMTVIGKQPEMINSEKIPLDPRQVMQGDIDIKATDTSSTVSSKITVTPEMERLAIKGNHFETVNLDLEDTHGAHGTEDSTMFRLMAGSTDDAGGGGLNGNTLDDSVGVGAQTSPGDGGGWGGGSGIGIGTNKGSGTGTFGGRKEAGRVLMVMNHGGSKATINASLAALQWLAYHQEADGHWDTMKYGSAQKTDTAITGMALLAFLGAGHTEKAGGYKDNVKRAVAWLKSKQQASGLIFDGSDAGAHRGIGYPTAIATLAMVEAAGMASVPDTRSAAQKAIDYCTSHQCGEGSDKLGWRYNPKQPGDTSVTGWFVMALKSAKVANLHVDHAAFEGALAFLKTVEIKNDGGADNGGYGPAVHYGYQPGAEHVSSTHRLTAIGSLIQMFMGAPKEQVAPSVEWFVNKGGVPSWGANGEAVDMYYWYYGSLCAFQVDGDVWKRWNTGMMKALTENQCKNGDDHGSWPIVGEFSTEWGRVGQTALGCLSLEVYYRYEQLKNMKGN